MGELPEPDVERASEESLDRLAAIHAALDESRRTRHCDILVSATLEVLSRADGLSISRLTRALRETWQTDSISEPLVEEALRFGYEANLFRRETALDGAEQWGLTDAAATEIGQDKAWATSMLEVFESDVRDRIEDLAEPNVGSDKAPNLAKHVLAALAAGTAGTYSIQPTAGSQDRLRPQEVDLHRIQAYIAANLNTRPRRRVTLELCTAALDPDDDFGNEVLRLLTVGNLLHGFLARRDLPESLDLTGHRLLLDTNVLVDLLDDGTANQRLVQNLLDLASQLHVEVTVAEHTLEEWERVWKAAEEEVGTAAIPAQLSDRASRLASNPFVRIYLTDLADTPSMTWTTFERGRRDLRPQLSRLGISVRPARNETDPDAQVEEIRDHLLYLSAQNDIPGSRNPRSAAADAESCALVMRWRREAGDPTSAYLVAREILTARAHQDLFPERANIPITISPTAWVMFAASLNTDDPASQRQIAEVVADASIRSSFFGVASGYTLQEVLDIADHFTQGNIDMGIEDTRTAIQLDLLDLIEEDAQDASVLKRASVLTQRRIARRTERLQRQEKRLDTTLEAAEDRRAKEERGRQAAESARDSESRRATDAENRELRTDRQRRSAIRWAWVGSVGGILTTGTLALVIAGVIEGVGIAIAIGLLLLYWVKGSQAAIHPDRPTTPVVLTGIGEVAYVLLIEIGASR